MNTTTTTTTKTETDWAGRTVTTTWVDFGLRDERGRAVGAVIKVAVAQDGKVTSTVQAGRNGSPYGACQPWKVAKTAEEALAAGHAAAALTAKRYAKKYGAR